MAELNARIKPKKSSVSGETPGAGDLEVAEIAVNTADGKLFVKHTDNSIKEISGSGGGGGGDSLVADEVPSRCFTNYEANEPQNVSPIGSPLGSVVDVPEGKAYSVDGNYGDGSNLPGFFKAKERYDIVNLEIQSSADLNTSNRISIGGSKGDLAAGPGWCMYTRATGFGFYGDGAFEELGTLPTMVADTWYEVTYVLDWGTGARTSAPAISIWVDGAIAVSDVTPSAAFTVRNDGDELNLYFPRSNSSTNTDTKLWRNIRVLNSATPLWGMTEATISSPATLIDGVATQAQDNDVPLWSSVESKYLPGTLGVMDLDDVFKGKGGTWTYFAAESTTPEPGEFGTFGSREYINTIDKNGVNYEADFARLTTSSTNPEPVRVYRTDTGAIAYDGTWRLSTVNSARASVYFTDGSWLDSGDYEGVTLIFYSDIFGSAFEDGSLMSWNASRSVFEGRKIVNPVTLLNGRPGETVNLSLVDLLDVRTENGGVWKFIPDYALDYPDTGQFSPWDSGSDRMWFSMHNLAGRDYTSQFDDADTNSTVFDLQVYRLDTGALLYDGTWGNDWGVHDPSNDRVYTEFGSKAWLSSLITAGEEVDMLFVSPLFATPSADQAPLVYDSASSAWIAGSEAIPLATLKTVVADSTDFADFQSKIAAL